MGSYRQVELPITPVYRKLKETLAVFNRPVLYTRVERDLTRYGMLSAYTPLRVCTACRQMMLEESRARGNGGWEDTC
jgi:hypothetical protein